jgi:hypothetical protein
MSAAGDDQHYAYRPSLLGAAHEFRLSGNTLNWAAGRRAGSMPLRDVKVVRLSFQPASMQPHRFVTELWADNAPRLVIVSSSWKSVVEQERLDERYTVFVTELHRRIADAKAPAQFVQGKRAFTYWPALVLFVAVALGLAVLVTRALQAQSLGGAIFIAAFLALFLWHGGNFFRRNKPGRYRPDALPPDLLPKLRAARA